MTAGYIILARYNSSRLPGKALLEVKGKPLLWHIDQALQQVASAEQIVIATSDQPFDQPIASFCEQQGIQCFRGSLDNVADRFYQCAVHYHFTYATRINGDNLFVSLETIEAMQQYLEKAQPDFLSNVKDRTFPYGMSVEMVNVAFYQQILPFIQDDKRFCEHVTLYLYENQMVGQRKYFYNMAHPEAAGLPLAIDTDKDLAFARKMATLMERPFYSYNLPALYQLYQKVKQDL